MNKRLFKPRHCRECGKGFEPMYANQRTHRKCFRLWRRRYFRRYQRKVRRDIKTEFSQEAYDAA